MWNHEEARHSENRRELEEGAAMWAFLKGLGRRAQIHPEPSLYFGSFSPKKGSKKIPEMGPLTFSTLQWSSYVGAKQKACPKRPRVIILE